ncbi:GRB10-interacting GYF protein 1 [Trichonephila clavipes]|uniref:GRB10-interacting GYF protein 1 n=1 Tax=Trichonephila clavipes TaxID=2585209 RepID=A0A8X6VE99_TRICX|nr:GRB10-interacting GYF protein 1 [Trichonephila clavipes]
MITNFFIPELNNHDVQELWFQQDGTTCHTARATIDLLKDTFSDRLSSSFGPVNWPPRSCDLTPLDYFLWGYVKSLVYADKPQTLDHLEDNIRRVIADIWPQMLEKVIENWTSRLDYIRASRGSPMPEIIFKICKLEMGETALNFGPDWIRALSTGSTSAPPPTSMPIPRYSLAEFRYGREEMLALIPKEIKMPNCLKQYPQLTKDKFQIPLALTPATEEEQRLWSRSVNSEQAFRASGKTGPGYSMHRTGRGGSVDRGRGRGRGGYYQRGLMHDDTEDGLPFSRPKPVERSLSASEKDHRWDDRDRRYDRTYSGRGGIDDSGLKQDMRGPNEYWRRVDKDDDGDWRTSGFRAADKPGSRGPWRSNSERDRRDMAERTPPSRSSSGNIRSGSGSQPKQSSHSSWKDDNQGKLPEWSVEETTEPDSVGTFDSSGAFLETKVSENASLDEVYASDDADEGIPEEDSPEANKEASKKATKKSYVSIKKLSANKQSSKPSSDVKNTEEKPIPITSEHSKSSSPKNKRSVGKSTENVIKQNTVTEKQTNVETESNLSSPISQPNVPTHVSEPVKTESVILSNVKNSESAITRTGVVSEEEGFAYHQKATENMVAQWTEEIEEQRVPSQTNPTHPTHVEKDNKWFYQDPQGEIQGPFAPQEMLEWYNSGYFSSNLMVRRSCDEKFSKLGDLIEAWGCIPFIPCNNPPPIRMPAPLGGPINPTIVPNPVIPSTSAQLPKPDEQILALQQQLFQQQIMQQQLLLRQAQIQQILSQLKQEDTFTNLNSQQQQQIVMQQFLAQQIPRPPMKPMGDKPNLMDAMNPLSLPHLGLPLPLIKPAWLGAAPGSESWPGPPGGSIWDADITKQNAEMTESEKLKLLEEHEKKRKVEELKLQQEREAEEKRMEELKRQQEEARIIQELQRQEEERKRIGELQRQQEEERRRQDELKRLEEEERQRQEELRRQEEIRKQEEQRRLEELRKQEEQRKLEEKKRKEEKRLEELKKKEQQRQEEELRKQQELRKLEEKRKKEEMQKKIQLEKEKERLLEIERQKEALRQKELEREERVRKEKERKEKEEEDLRRLAELKIKSQGPVWGIQNNLSNVQLSLADIQRLQQEKDREEREERARQLLLQQQSVKQVQQVKNGLSWAKRANDSPPVVKSLAEIQQEEAERLAKLNKMQKPPAPVPTVNSNAGVWGNSSHLSKITAAPSTWNMNNVSSSNHVISGGFWDDALSSTQIRKQPSKANTSDSAFPALANPKQSAHVSSNKGKSVRAKKEEDAVARLFGSHHKPTDEFTKWCTEAISTMPSSVDVPTFVAFLKDIESPYEVYDYVKSYFGEGKEAREFAKQFLEKRSKCRNQAKQAPPEDNTLWGPAPAITPTVNKNIPPTSNDNDGISNTKGKSKKRKGKMQKLDSSMLGFTVQPNPDRLNVGEMDHIENM